MRPPFAYLGGKTRLAPWIASLLPAHRVYIEPFCGSAAVLFAKDPSRCEILNDIDGEVVHFFRVLRERPDELAEMCAWTPYARDEFGDAHELSDDPLERARRFWVRSLQGFGGRVNETTGWSVSVAEHTWRPRTIAGRVLELRHQAARLLEVAIENRDAFEIIGRLGMTDDVCVYVDPPYLFSSRGERARQRSGGYEHEMGKDENHRALAEVLRASSAAVLISGYPDPLYDDLYAGWWRTERRSVKSIAHRSGVSGAASVEVVWSNRPLHAQGRFTLFAPPVLNCDSQNGNGKSAHNRRRPVETVRVTGETL